MKASRPTLLAILALLSLAGVSVRAQGDDLPRWASLRFDKTNMRVGPSREYPIAWIYKREGLPVKVLRVRDEWELVEEPDGTRGWISGSQLSRTRSALVMGEGLANLLAEPQENAAIRWRAQPGVVGTLISCRDAWCEIDLANAKQRKDGISLKGWVQRARLWGSEDLPGDK